MAEDATRDQGKLLKFTCDEHGHLYDGAVFCVHDADTLTRSVMDAHRATYGADCKSPVTAELLDLDTRTPIPGGQSRWSVA
jgi:hypothetical protein